MVHEIEPVTGASELRRFDPPLRVDDASLATIQREHPWIRACCSEWMPWAFTFEEWKSSRSQKFLDRQKIDAAKFGLHQQAVATQLTSHGTSILATFSLAQSNKEFLIVISCAEKLDRFPRQKNDLPSGIQKTLLKKSGDGWLLVDLGTDLPYDNPVVQEMLSIHLADLESPGRNK